MMSKELVNGWLFDVNNGAVCHFEHFPLSKAEELQDEAESVFIVETINWTLSGNGKTVHHNKYFMDSLSSAIGVAAKLEISSKDVAENVVSIHTATDTEAGLYDKVSKYFDRLIPPAISEEQANLL
jgi:hypothetical protein